MPSRDTLDRDGTSPTNRNAAAKLGPGHPKIFPEKIIEFEIGIDVVPNQSLIVKR